MSANRAKACSALRSKFLLRFGSARRAARRGRPALGSTARPSCDQGVARGEIVEAAKRVLQVLECREQLRPALGARLAGKRAGKKLGGIAKPLGANAQSVPLPHAAMPEVGALALDPFAKPDSFVLAWSATGRIRSALRSLSSVEPSRRSRSIRRGRARRRGTASDRTAPAARA